MARLDLVGGRAVVGQLDVLIEPTNLGQPSQADRPVMGVVQPFFYQAPLADPGDFDNDGDVDGADFLIWQRGESTDPSSTGDLTDWQANYGLSSLATATAPKPSAIVLASFGDWSHHCKIKTARRLNDLSRAR